MTVVAPVLVLTSGTADNTPTFAVFGDIQVGDVETLEYATNSSFSGSSTVGHTITSGDISGGSFSWSTGSLADGTWYFRCTTNRAGDISPPSNVQTETISTGGVTISLDALASTGTVGVAYSDSAFASGGTAPYTYAVFSGSLPTSLSLDTSGGTAGLVHGTPSAAGLFTFTIRATDSGLPSTGDRSYSITISSAGGIVISPTFLPGGTVGVGYSQTITASGGTGPYTFAVTSGSLPAGLSLSSGGLLSGTPTTPGSSSFSITATDSLAATSSPQAYNVTISSAAPPAILMPQICM